MKRNLKHILFISAWYPNRKDAMSGLFVRKHAEAVSLYNQVSVLHVVADGKIKKTEIESNQENNLTEIIVYYPDFNFPVLGFLYKVFKLFLSYHIGYQLVVEKQSKPNLVHANILTRTGFMALFIKILRGIPYVLSEHWSRYLPARNGYHGIIRKALSKIVVQNASYLMPVSTMLKDAMSKHGLVNKNTEVVGNVVDPCFFRVVKSEEKNEKIQLLHISCFDEKAKNVKGILNAIQILANKRNDFQLHIVGTGVDFQEVYSYSQQLHLQEEIIHFHGELPPREVAEMFAKSDIFILFSRYETAGVVIAESLVTGTPIVTTSVGIAPEYINENNGILVNSEAEAELADALNFMMDHPEKYNSEVIRKGSDIFSFENTGKTLDSIYQQVLRK